MTSVSRRVATIVAGATVTVAAIVGPSLVANAATVSVSNNFDAGNQLSDSYTVYTVNGSVTQQSADGIGGSGSLYADPSETDSILVTKQAFDISTAGKSVTLSAFVHNTTDSGYFTMGITSYPDASTHNTAMSALRPSDAAGFAAHGGGFVSLVEGDESGGNWDSDNAPTFQAVHISSLYNMISAASDDQWYKIVVTVTRTANDTFDLDVAVWPAHTDGTMVDGATDPLAEFILPGAAAPTLAAASQVYGYMGFSWNRFDRADNVVITGDAAVTSGGTDSQSTELTTLPDTGANDVLPGVIAVASMMAGAIVLLAVRRRTSRD